ncbi:MAG: hypothetical protein OXG89_01985 [bacterium]|nr:hypothetical protein [bacterium]
MTNGGSSRLPPEVAQTVLGPVLRQDLGFVLPHEHLIIDFGCRYRPGTEENEVQLPFDPGDRWRLVAAPAAHRVNLLRLSTADAVYELQPFIAANGRTVVDLTTVGLGNDRGALAEVAKQSGVNLVGSTGVYVHRSHPDWVHTSSLDELADRMVADLTPSESGDPPAGVIGEIGVEEFEWCELKVLEASAIAASRTGASVWLHVVSGALPEARPPTIAAVERYIAAGGDPYRLVLCHQDGSGNDPGYQDDLLARGVVLEYDTFGFQTGFTRDGAFVQLPSDTRRIREVADLWRRGRGDRILLSHDLCYRMMTRQWGGWGLGHLPTTLRPRFTELGIDEDRWRTMTVDTPGRLLAGPPQP